MYNSRRLGRRRALAVALTALSVAGIQAGTAGAATRTYVNADNGANGLGCTSRIPCSTIQAAIDQTDAGGTVVITDSATYSPITVSKSVSIVATGAHRPEIRGSTAVLTNPGTSGDVTLKGLTIVGTNDAVFWNTGGLELDGDSLRGSGGTSVGVECSFAGGDGLQVTDSSISGFGDGMACLVSGATITVEHSRFRRDDVGMFVRDCDSFTVDSSTFVHDSTYALSVGCLAIITHSRISYNGTGVYVSPGTGHGAYLGSSILVRNGTAWSGNVVSYGDNVIVGNRAGDTGPPHAVSTS